VIGQGGHGGERAERGLDAQLSAKEIATLFARDTTGTSTTTEAHAAVALPDHAEGTLGGLLATLLGRPPGDHACAEV
jgi:hypothetical protein